MNKAFESLCASFARLPGMGRKSAERAALHLAFADRKQAEALVENLRHALDVLTPCPKCCGISENNALCEICSDSSRNHSSVCLVETAADMAATYDSQTLYTELFAKYFHSTPKVYVSFSGCYPRYALPRQ